jgi:hypothetical protein
MLLSAVFLAACSDPDARNRLEIETVSLQRSNGTLVARLEQTLTLSDKARSALRRGVPLTFQVELILRDKSSSTRIAEREDYYELRYLPLSDRFQLTLPGGQEIRTFPRLRHLLSDLGRLELVLTAGALPNGEYELMARTRIDQRKLPIAMRLPILFDPDWQHSSAWSSWPLTVDASA